MTLGAFVSSSFAGPIAKFMGRRGCIWVASVMCAVANILMMASTNIGAVYFGRLLIGLANGMFMTFSQLYIQVSTDTLHLGILIGTDTATRTNARAYRYFILGIHTSKV